MTTKERLEDTEIALHIAQVERDKWKARALKLAKVLGIRDCDIDDFKMAEHGDLKDVSQLVYDCSYNNGSGCDRICHCDDCNYHVVRESDIKGLPTIIPATKKENEFAESVIALIPHLPTESDKARMQTERG